jgi:hypothetical protein
MTMATIMIRDLFNRLYAPGMWNVQLEEFQRYEPIYPRIFNVKTSKRKYEEDYTIVGFSRFSTKTEGAELELDSYTAGYYKTYTHDTYAKYARITEEAIEDDLYGPMNEIARCMGIAARETYEYEAARLFNYITVTTYFTGGDGLALASASHKWSADIATTWSNTGSAAALTTANLEAAIAQIRGLTDGAGKTIQQVPRILLVGLSLEGQAYRILESPLVQELSTNAVNAIKGRYNLDLIVWPYLTSSTQWVVLCDNNALIFWNRLGLKSRSEEHFGTGDMQYKSRFRFKVGCNSPHPIYSNAGA